MYKIGDKVRIRDDLEVGFAYGNYRFEDEMKPLKGKVVTISRIKVSLENGISLHSGYGIDEDGGQWGWTDEMIEGLAEPIKTNLDHYAEALLKYIDKTDCPNRDNCPVFDSCYDCPLSTIYNSFIFVSKLKTDDFIEWCKEEYIEPKEEPKEPNKEKLIYIYENLDGLSHTKVRELLREVIENEN